LIDKRPDKPPEKLPVLSGAAILKALKKGGFRHVSTKGDHVKVRHAETQRTAIVPLYDSIAGDLLSSILSQSGLSREEFGRRV
jgi:predicted RNA binding protein YcfA (HicA-like mRNA interferase family)